MNRNTKTDKKLKIIYSAITISIMVFIFVQSAMPDVVSAEESNFIVRIITGIIEKTNIGITNEEMISFLVRKTAHFTEYAVFGASIYLTAQQFFFRKWWIAVLSWLAGTLYAVSDEIHQIFVPGRFGQVTDVMIDSCGVALGVLITFLILSAVSKKKSGNMDSNSDSLTKDSQ